MISVGQAVFMDQGEERRRVSGMAPGAVYEVEIGWYVARKRGGLHA